MLMRPEQDYKIFSSLRLRDALKELKENLHSTSIQMAAFLLHDVLIALWTMKWAPTIGHHLQDPTICFIALTMLECDGGFKEAKHTTGPVARFEYCMRLIFLVRMKRMTMQEDEPMDYESASLILQRWYTEKHDSTFNSLRSLTHRATAIARSSTSLPRVLWLDHVDFQSMLYNGDPVHLVDLRKAFVMMENDMVDLWENKVLCGLKLHIQYADIADDLTNTAVGYNFLADHRNECFDDYEDHLLKAVLANSATRKKFVVRNDSITGNVVWNKAALRAWLYNYGELQAVEMIRTEMLAGSPGRITELACMNACNTKTRSTRNLVVLGKNLAVLVMYHKGGSMTGQDKLIPHALDGLTSDILIQDLLLARPFARIAAQICFPENRAIRQLYRERLFVRNGKEFTATQVTALMKHYTLPTVGVGLGVNPYRHIHSVWQRKLCPASLEIMDLSNMDSVAAVQAGRSRDTDIRTYGISHDDLHGAPEDVLPMFIDCSTQWQATCHVVPGGLDLSYMEARSANFHKLVHAGQITSMQTASAKEASNTQAVAKAVMEMLKPALEDLVTKTVMTAFQTYR